jgi:hypothetical protein
MQVLTIALPPLVSGELIAEVGNQLIDSIVEKIHIRQEANSLPMFLKPGYFEKKQKLNNLQFLQKTKTKTPDFQL